MIRLMLADNHRIFREGLRSLLSGQKAISIVAEAESGEEVLAKSGEAKPDIVIMDIGSPALDANEVTRRISRENGRIRVIGLSSHEDQDLIWQFLASGGAAYLLKDCRLEELLTALHWVSDGQVYLSPAITKGLLQDFESRRNAPREDSYALLTAREREVLQLLAEGRSAKEAAADLSISFKTVNTHRQNIMEKLNIHSVAELTRYAVREGLTAL